MSKLLTNLPCEAHPVSGCSFEGRGEVGPPKKLPWLDPNRLPVRYRFTYYSSLPINKSTGSCRENVPCPPCILWFFSVGPWIFLPDINVLFSLCQLYNGRSSDHKKCRVCRDGKLNMTKSLSGIAIEMTVARALWVDVTKTTTYHLAEKKCVNVLWAQITHLEAA